MNENQASLRSPDTVQDDDPVRSADTVQVPASERTPRDRLFDAMTSLRRVLDTASATVFSTEESPDTQMRAKALALYDLCRVIVAPEPPTDFIDASYWMTSVRAQNLVRQLQPYLMGQKDFDVVQQLTKEVLNFHLALELYQQELFGSDRLAQEKTAFKKVKGIFQVVDGEILAFEQRFFAKQRNEGDIQALSAFLASMDQILLVQQTNIFRFLASTSSLATLRDCLRGLKEMGYMGNGSGELWMSEVRKKMTAIKGALTAVDLQLQALEFSGYFSSSGIVEIASPVIPPPGSTDWDDVTITDYPSDVRRRTAEVLATGEVLV